MITNFIWCLLSFIGICESAGIAVHLTIAARLHGSLPDAVKERYPYFLAGAFFPDAFYGCMGKSDYAEEAHWPPFIKAAVEAFLSKEEGSDQLDLKAFIYGIFTHQIADIPWHSLRGSQGLLEMLSMTEFNGTTSDAHTFLDTAGDFILLSKVLENLDLASANKVQKLYETKWVYPKSDIVAIYRSLGYPSFSGGDIDFCMMRGYAALQGELTGTRTSLLTNNRGYFINQSPLLDRILDEYPYGGIDQIESSIQTCMKALDEWFTGNLPENPWTICSIFDSKSNNDRLKSDIDMRYSPISIRKDDDNSISINFQSSRMVGQSLQLIDASTNELAIGDPFAEKYGGWYILPIKDIFKAAPQVKLYRYMHDPYGSNGIQFPPRLGFAITTWKVTKTLKLTCISEPGSSIIRIFHDNVQVVILNEKRSNSSLGAPGLKCGGMRITAIDTDAAGVQDMLVSSWVSDASNEHSQPQLGRVYILSGLTLAGKLSATRHPIHIDVSELIKTEYHLPDRLRSTIGYTQAGTSTAITKHLAIIGVNALGALAVFDRLTGILLTTVNLHQSENGHIQSKDTGLFAFEFMINGNYRGSEWILVSSSHESYGNCLMCGASYLYIVRGFFLHRAARIIPGTSDSLSYTHFGTSATFSDRTNSKVLISGNNYLKGCGAVWEIPVDQMVLHWLATHHEQLYIVNSIVAIGPSEAGFTDFGRALRVFEHENQRYMAVGLPRYGYSETTSSTRGQLRIYPI